MKRTLSWLALTACVLAGAVRGETTLLNASFDGVANGLLEEFSFLGNTDGVAAGGNWSQSDGVLSMAQDVSGAGTVGMVSNAPFDGTGLTELVVTWQVDGVTDPNNGPTNNGLFLGLMGQVLVLDSAAQTGFSATGLPSVPVVLEIADVRYDGTVEVDATGFDTTAMYQMVRDGDLQGGSSAVVDGPRAAAGFADTFKDLTPPNLPSAAYYRIEQLP